MCPGIADSDEASRAGFHVVDLIPEFAKRTDDDWRVWWAKPYGGHPGDAAHRVAAETIAWVLSEQGWLAIDTDTVADAATVLDARP